MTERAILFGAGGHAKVVLEAWRAAHPAGEIVVLDDDPAAIGRHLLGVALAGGRSWLDHNWADAPVIPAIGDNDKRAALIETLKAMGRGLASVVHPTAIVSPTATIGVGSFLAPGAIVNAESQLGEGVIINTGASVDHDCRIGTAAHIAPGARLCGGVTVGPRALIGTGSAVIPGIAIGECAVIGAGSVVLREVPAGARWAGCPARAIGRPGSAFA